MKRKLLLFFASILTLVATGFLAILFMVYYEPTPNKAEVEEMVGANNLAEFGEVEGSYLLTPRNYGFYNDGHIFVVEQYLDKGEEYGDQYVVIEEGTDLTAEDEQAINQVKAKYIPQQDSIDDLQVVSKHRMSVYKKNEKVEEKWLFKVVYTYDGEYVLSFLLPEKTGEDKFNFFIKGCEQFRQF